MSSSFREWIRLSAIGGHCKPQDGQNIGKRLGEFTIGVSEEELEYIKDRMYEEDEEDEEEEEVDAEVDEDEDKDF